MPSRQATVLDARALDRTLRRMADEIVELNDGTDDLVIVGIQRRGVQLAARIVSSIAEREGASVPRGALDITLYRDDLQTVGPRPVVGATDIPVDIDHRGHGRCMFGRGAPNPHLGSVCQLAPVQDVVGHLHAIT